MLKTNNPLSYYALPIMLIAIKEKEIVQDGLLLILLFQVLDGRGVCF